MRQKSFIAAVLMMSPLPATAQSAASPSGPTAEQMMERAHDLYRAPGTRKPCKPAEGNEIVVCAADETQFRTDSSLDDAIREGRTYDEVPRAPDLVPPCPGCKPMGGPPYRPLLIDLNAIPEALPADQARQVSAAVPAATKP